MTVLALEQAVRWAGALDALTRSSGSPHVTGPSDVARLGASSGIGGRDARVSVAEATMLPASMGATTARCRLPAPNEFQLAPEPVLVRQQANCLSVRLLNFANRFAKPIQCSRQVAPSPRVPGRRSLQLKHTL